MKRLALICEGKREIIIIIIIMKMVLKAQNLWEVIESDPPEIPKKE